MISNTEKQPRLQALLVEDSEDDIAFVNRLAATCDVDVDLRVARDGETALALLSQPSLPQVILLDLNLPRFSGIDLLNRIKTEQKTMDIPVIVVSGTEDDALRRKTLLAYTLITKPISETEFFWIMRSVESYWRKMDRIRKLETIALNRPPAADHRF